MVDNNTKHQDVQKLANGIRVAVVLAVLSDLYNLYLFFSAPGDFRHGLSIALGVLGTALLWQMSRQLRAGKKQSLYYWFGLVVVGYANWFFIDAAFEWNILSIMLLTMTLTLTRKMVLFTRQGMLA